RGGGGDRGACGRQRGVARRARRSAVPRISRRADILARDRRMSRSGRRACRRGARRPDRNRTQGRPHMKWVLRIVGALVGLAVLAVLVLFALSKRPDAGKGEVSIEIAQPPAVVWAWITEPEKLKQWV